MPTLAGRVPEIACSQIKTCAHVDLVEIQIGNSHPRAVRMSTKRQVCRNGCAASKTKPCRWLRERDKPKPEFIGTPTRPPARKRATRRTAVYFMGNSASGQVKIGISTDPERRRRDIEFACGTPVDLLAIEWFDSGFAARDEESRLHCVFGEHRTIGEWFKLK